MLTAEQNQQLTRVKPGTPMGELFRRYWHPCRLLEMKERNTFQVKILGKICTLQDRLGAMGL
jgi:5,5'-dehydrodivanillate O-demethylase